MRIAVACDGLDIAPLYTQCRSYMCYTVTFGVISSAANVPLTETVEGSVIEFFKDLEIDVLIAGQISDAHVAEFAANGIEVIRDQSGSASEAVCAYVSQEFSSEGCWDDDSWE